MSKRDRNHATDSAAGARGRAASTLRAILRKISLLPLVGALALQAQSTFPATTIGNTASAQQVTVTLPAGGTVQSISVVTQGATGLDFQQMGSSSCASATLSAGQTCTVPVQFSPLYPGMRTGAVVLIGGSGTVIGTQYISGVGNGGLGIFVPGTMMTAAGNGNYTSLGDGGLATHAGLRLPFGVAKDGAGNLYIADSGEYRIRRVDAQSLDISTYAGTGTESYTGDGGLATNATMGTPVGLALDGAGNLYFADSTEHVVRRIDAVTHIITTVAGTGTHGFSGDGGPANAAELSAPYGVTIDGQGDLYIADTGNNRIRRVDAIAQDITTVAGGGAVTPTLGDGGAATSAALDQPYDSAFDSSANLYIADAGNNRIREVNAISGDISTVAGTGTPGFSGDTGPPAQAELYFPASVAFDPAGNMYIADTQNNRIRKVENGTINTIAGNSSGKYGGDGASALLAGMYGPYFVYLDASGSLYIGDYYDNRIREVQSNTAILTYPNALRVGQTSPPQIQGIENDGNAVLSFSAIASDANAATDPNTTTCSTMGTIVPDQGCLVGAEFAPTQVGNPVVGNIVLSGMPVDLSDTPMTIMVVGQALALNTTDVSLINTPHPSTFGQSVSLIATVSTGTGTPTGTVTYKDGNTTLGTATLTGSGTATYSTASLQVGPHSITAVYGGDSEHSGSTSPAVTQDVQSTTATAITTSAASAAVNTSVTFTATVSQTSGGTPLPGTTPSGTVLFSDGSTPLGSGTLQSNGTWTYATSSLAVGAHTITAAYQGDTFNLPSTSPGLTETITKQLTSTALSSSLNPAYYGNSITYTATVSVTGTGPATGPVTLLNGSTQIGSAVQLNNAGQAVFTVSTLPTGTDSITAHYGGDANNASSISNAVTQTVQKATTSDTLTSSLSPAIAGKAFTLTATIADTNGSGVATGSVSFANGASSLGTGTLNGGGVATTPATLGPGTFTLTSAYAGDTNHAASNGSLSLTVQQATTSVSVTATPNPSTLGQSVGFTIHVSGNGGTPGGTVTLSADGNQLGTAATLSSGSATITSSSLSVGTHAMTATYSGDTNDAASTTASAYTQTVNKSTSTVSETASPNPVVAGNSVTFTATVHGTTGNPTPTGSVQFVDGSTTLGTMTLSGGVATYSTTTLSPGQHTITANYGGDTDYSGSSSTVTEGVQRSTTVTLTSSSNPSIAGTSITFTMQVTGTGSTPTGTITLLDGSSTLAIRTLDGSGTATYTTSALAAGTHALTASYAGDTNNGPATSAVLSEQVNQATTTTTLASGANPSIAGKTLVLTATVAGNGGTPTGHVNFLDGSQQLGSGTLNGSGTATLSVSALAPGTHSLSAVYAGDANDLGSTSITLSETVQQAVTTTILSVNPNPSVVTRTVLLSAVVSSNGGTPSGSVVFALGSTTLATVALPSGGTATFSINSLPLGSDQITASYSGDTDDGTSQGSATATVQQASPTLTLTSTLNPSQVGNAVTLIATATNTAATVTGTVTFLEGGTTLGTASVGGQNAAMLTLTTLALGTHTITASYSGDADNSTAQSAALTQTVQQTTTTQLTASPDPSLGGKPVVLTAVVLGANGSAPSGTVAFKDSGTTIGSAALSSGTATFTTSTLAIGTHSLTAVYSGDSLDLTSTSATVAETISSAGTTTMLTSSGSPALFGATVSFTAQVSGSGAAPTGTVTFKDGATSLGNASLGPSGQAIFSINSLAPGSHSITANYAGDADNQPSASAVLAQVIQAQTTTTLTAAPPSAIATSPVTLTAQVSSNAGTHPGGQVSFSDGTTVLGTAALDQNSQATLSVATFASGMHSLTATYAGDAVDAGSTSTAAIENIQPIPTNTHLGLSASTVAESQPVTMVAVITSAYSAPFTGTVTFSSGTTTLGQSTVGGGGTATLSTPLAIGSYNIVASYSGDAYNAPSSSTPVPLTVTLAGGTSRNYQMTLNPTALTMASKQNSTVTISIGSMDGFADTIGLGCASLPRLVTCTFSKDVVTLAANGTASVQLTVDTASPLTSGGVAATTAPNGPAQNGPAAGKRLPISLACLLPGSALLGWVLCRGRRRWARLLVWLLVATAAGTTFSLSGCSGLSSNGAAPGTYTIQVTAYGNATGIQHSVDLTLKVTQ